MVIKSKAPLLPIPEEGSVDFTKRIRNVSVRYLNSQEPTRKDLDQWIVLPLYQKKQDMPLDDDGKTALLLAHVDVLRQVLSGYDRKMKIGNQQHIDDVDGQKKRKIDKVFIPSELLVEEGGVQIPVDEFRDAPASYILEEGEIDDCQC